MGDTADLGDAKTPSEVSSSQSAIGTLVAKTAQMRQSAAREIAADRAELTLSAALQTRASLVEARQSALGLVQTNEVFVRQGATAAIRADNARVGGLTGLVAGDHVRMEGGASAVVAARRVTGRQIKALVVIGNQVEGDVHVALDERRALLAGLLGGLVCGLILALTRVALRRD